MNGRARGAYIELNWPHGEIVGSFAKIATHAGADLDFFVLRENLASDPFGGLTVEGRVVPIDVADPHHPCAGPTGLEHHWTSEHYDFVIIGTAEPDDRIRFALGIDLPKLLVVHNPPPQLPELPNVSWVVLTDALARRHPEAMCLRAWFFGERQPDRASRDTRFGVVGNLQVNRRNYGSLLRALATLRDDGVTPAQCEIRIIGRWSDAARPPGLRLGLDGERLFAEADQRGVGEYLHLESQAELSHPQVWAALSSCRYALPLIDDFYLPTRRYVAGKCSGGVNQAIGLLTIPVVNDRLASGLGLHACHTYRLDDVASGIRRALGGHDDHLIAELAAYRNEGLARSAASLRQWIARL